MITCGRKQHNRTLNMKELVTLEVNYVGLVVYGIGAGAEKCSFRGEILADFLQKLWDKMFTLKDNLNKSWEKLDRNNPNHPENRAIMQEFLSTGAWAFALCMELAPFAPHCLHGPTNPLQMMFLRRLEEIFTKCFAAAHMYGNPDESMVALQGLVTDFETNGGINLKTGEAGTNLHWSIFVYFLAYFVPNNLEQVTYERFGELVGAIAARVASEYPEASEKLGLEIANLLSNTEQGFGRKHITSPAKTAMIEKLEGVVGMLETPPDDHGATKAS